MKRYEIHKHGCATSYRYGCRCEECRESVRGYNRHAQADWKKRRKARLSAERDRDVDRLVELAFR